MILQVMKVESHYRTCEYSIEVQSREDGILQKFSQCSLKNPGDCPHDIKRCIIGLPDDQTLELWKNGGFTTGFVRWVA